MDDKEILTEISALVEEEEDLRTRHREQAMSADDRMRVDKIEAALDQCWDLLRQRRAKREFSADPDRAQVRDSQTVEHYRQ